MSLDPWSAYLGELEGWTAEQSRLLALGELDALPADGVERPAADSVLPAALDGRARAALQALDRLQDDLRRRKDDVAQQLRSLSRATASPGGATSLYVDSYG